MLIIRKTSSSALVGLLFVILLSCNSYSQWSTDPYNNLIVGYGLLPEIASDSAGGIRAVHTGRYGRVGIVKVFDDHTKLPTSIRLYQNYPNPFNSSTVIKYDLPINGHVTLKIYDVLGREVTTLVNEYKEKGFYEVSWNAQSITSAVYFYKLVMSSTEPLAAGSYTSVKKMLLIR